jgi:gliding motility-associated-like protein
MKLNNINIYGSLAMAMVAFAMPAMVSAQSVSFSGNAKKVITITPDKNTGLNALYVVSTTQGLAVTYQAKNGGNPVWYSYSNLGGGYAQELSGITYDGNRSTLQNPTGDTGYIVEDGTDRYYFWITDYSAHPLRFADVQLPTEPECGMTTISISGRGDEIVYYTINGRRVVLSRDIDVEYQTLEWDEESRSFSQIQTKKVIDSIDGDVYISPAPLCNTTFYVTGDRFLEAWGEMQYVESATFYTNAVEVHTFADQVESTDEKSNQISSGDSGLGGSAPADITFKAYVSDAVMHSEWQFSDTEDFEEITYRFTDQELNYIFTEEGTTYVRFLGSNADGTCESEGETFTVSIGASDLVCPNAFSPGATEGVNDIWKVSYRSLVNFKCWIFDRNGVQLYYYEDPSGGWDGKYRGKLVKPGVYYYVIDATGSEGKHYKKSGDINIVRYKVNSSSSTSTTEE